MPSFGERPFSLVAMTTVALLWLAAAPGVSAQVPTRIPLCAGLTIVGAVSEPRGDYEPIVAVASVDDRAVRVKYTTNVAVGGGVRHITVFRAVAKDDLLRATTLINWFNPQASVTMSGTTAFGTSTAVLQALKTTGSASIALVGRNDSAAPADRNVHPNLYDYATPYAFQRAGSQPVLVPVTVNGVLVQLPAIRARGGYMGDRAEFDFLDDEANPLTLRFHFTPFGATEPSARSHTVKISHRCPTPASPPAMTAMERALAETGRVDVYDIYFDFASDRIREESAPTLRDIAEVLRRHPDWSLAIAGHTDNIGSDADNLQLSERRAASVKNELVGVHGIGANRLSTTGYGEAQPKDRNDTVEGRARNRRVELVRSSSGGR